MKKPLFALSVRTLMLTGCGGGSNDKNGEVPESSDENSTELSTEEVSTELCEISDWYVTDIQDVGLRGIGYYTSSGTSATGEELGIELTLKQYNEAITKLEGYNTFVNELKDRKYNNVKFAWEKPCEGTRESDKIVQNDGIKAKSGLDLKTDKLGQCQTAFQRYINALSKN